MDCKKKILITLYVALLPLILFNCGPIREHPIREGVRPQAKTRSLPGRADEVGIWVHPQDSKQSVIIGNDKAPMGALYVYDLQGKFVHRSERLNHPVGVSVRYGIPLSTGEVVDVVGCGIRSTNEIKIFKIDPETRNLIDITSSEGILSGYDSRTYGMCLYKRLSDGQLFAFVSRKETDHIHQIQLDDDGSGKIKGMLVRKFGLKQQKSFVEGMVADDEYGYLYCSDERNAILKYHADPSREQDPFIQAFGIEDKIHGDREGLALYKQPNGLGYVVVSSQGNSTFKIYKREENNAFVKSIILHDVWKTDGIAITSTPIPPYYPTGVFAAHNDSDNNYILFDWYECTKIR